MYRNYVEHTVLNEHSFAELVAWVEGHCAQLHDKARFLPGRAQYVTAALWR
jgi:hypothetical protein